MKHWLLTSLLFVPLWTSCKTTNRSETKSVQFSAHGRPFLLYKDGLDIKMEICKNVPDSSSLENAKKTCGADPSETRKKKMSEFLNAISGEVGVTKIPGLSMIVEQQKGVLQADVAKLQADLKELSETIDFLEVAFSDTADAELSKEVESLKAKKAEVTQKLKTLQDKITTIDNQGTKAQQEDDLMATLRELNQPIEDTNKILSSLISIVFSQERHLALRDDPKKDSSFRFIALKTFGLQDYFCVAGYEVRDGECQIKGCGVIEGKTRVFEDTWTSGTANGSNMWKCNAQGVVEFLKTECPDGYDPVDKTCVAKNCGTRKHGESWTDDTSSGTSSSSCSLGVVTTTLTCKTGYNKVDDACQPNPCGSHPHGATWTDGVPSGQGTIARRCELGNTIDGTLTCNEGWTPESTCNAKYTCGVHLGRERFAGDSWKTGTVCTGETWYYCPMTGGTPTFNRAPKEQCSKDGIIK